VSRITQQIIQEIYTEMRKGNMKRRHGNNRRCTNITTCFKSPSSSQQDTKIIQRFGPNLSPLTSSFIPGPYHPFRRQLGDQRGPDAKAQLYTDRNVCPQANTGILGTGQVCYTATVFVLSQATFLTPTSYQQSCGWL